MKSPQDLNNTLTQLLEQPANWLDKRHLKTLIWMIIGLIESGLISLTEWSTWTDSRATFAQSTVRRFSRWLTNDRIKVHTLYATIIAEALTEWGEMKLYLALDTSMLWDEFCLIRLSIIYRGRAVPLAWRVIKHGSATVAFDKYRPVLDQALMLLPLQTDVTLLADRGFADTGLMAYCDEYLSWAWIIRAKKSFRVYRPGKRSAKIGNLSLKRGQARCFHGISVTDQQYGPIHLAIGKPFDSKESWYLLSSIPTSRATFAEYGLRFDIEESFLDDKSNGFQLESSRLRQASSLNRLCFVLAVATLFLVSQGTAVVESKQRRFVDAHWFRGSSYLKIGWRWVRRARIKGWDLIDRLLLSPLPDLEPCFSSKSDVDKRLWQLEISVEAFGNFATQPV